MPDNLDDIKVLPRLSHPDEKGRIFRLVWVLDLVSDSSQCYVSLVFQNVKTGFIIVDRIPPELLSYCSVGSYFCSGKKLSDTVDGQVLQFTINSTNNNQIIDASEAFSDNEYDLSLNVSCHKYSISCKHQSCFVQQVGNTLIVIPCFVIAAAYYFKSTSLRETILSRRIVSLFHECTLDQGSKHATILLKDAGNVGDAKYIARLHLNEFAHQRLNLCKDHLYANKDATYKRLRIDFPVMQNLMIKARGCLSSNSDGGKTFIVFQIMEEDSLFPFNSIDIYYEKKEDLPNSTINFPANFSKHTSQMSLESPATNIVRRLLTSSPPVNNKYRQEIQENRIPTFKGSSGEHTSYPEYNKNATDLSSQPSAPTDDPVSEVLIREKEPGSDKRTVFELDEFHKLVSPLESYFTLTVSGDIEKVTGYSCEVKDVWKRKGPTNHLTLKESYNHSTSGRRQCAYISFEFLNHHVYIVEIDQTKLPGKGCSTMVLVSGQAITQDIAELCVKGYVLGHDLKTRERNLKDKGVKFLTKNHPQLGDMGGYISWRLQLMGRVERAMQDRKRLISPTK